MTVARHLSAALGKNKMEKNGMLCSQTCQDRNTPIITLVGSGTEVPRYRRDLMRSATGGI